MSATIETDNHDDSILMQIGDGAPLYLADRDGAEREDPIFEEIHEITVEVANSYADPEAVTKVLPTRSGACKPNVPRRAVISTKNTQA